MRGDEGRFRLAAWILLLFIRGNYRRQYIRNRLRGNGKDFITMSNKAIKFN
ncbi:hypothetical protein NT01EI_1863 [Edwardsiella ictaluri 93-146]|uniref:Uncharacterized protein n=1 Tax=Edwardsiella ictaluri (strain 93-146) TaxID=634503 RepID=C5BGW1_EDWI9|nr:hypothetical protein NT01EI_1863 [Edwardsiella ictaluri 93-146]